MAKQVIIGALEEVLGEYVLNMDKEHLKIAALRGKIKLRGLLLLLLTPLLLVPAKALAEAADSKMCFK